MKKAIAAKKAKKNGDEEDEDEDEKKESIEEVGVGESMSPLMSAAVADISKRKKKINKDEDEDENPVGKDYNEDVEIDEAGRPKGAARIENERFWDLKDKELHYIIKDAGQAVQANPTSKKATQGPGNWSDQINDAATVLYYRKKKKIKVEGFEGPFTAPGSGSIAKQRKAKASDEKKSIEQQVADARQEGLAFQENEWDSMWKNAAKSRPKMSFKQATEFVNEVGLDKKEKTNALKTAKKCFS